MNPLRLLRLEWLKYSPSTTFRVFCGLYAGAFVLVVFLAWSVGQNMHMNFNGTMSSPFGRMFDYPSNWKLLASLGSWMNFFVLGSLGVFMITMEFSNRTLRQSVIFGLTRMEVAVAKLIWNGALALGATGFYILVTLGEELLVGGGVGLPPVLCLVGFFVQALGYLFLGTMVGLLIRQTALAILGYLAYVVFLESACRWIFYLSIAKTRLLLFLPDHVLGALTPFPVPDSVNHVMSSSSPFANPLTFSEALLGAIVYLGLFGLIFGRRIIKADL